jgi:hypothetical protein
VGGAIGVGAVTKALAMPTPGSGGSSRIGRSARGSGGIGGGSRYSVGGR